ncbi:MAG: type IX secretion system membrane protein PorP/SprF [Bacteroidetes bacterium]|nr:type IX secretion system membrane protein PorP/SprF [Bacteroidota bacterium]
MKKILTALLVFIAVGVAAQQDALFSQYMFNKMALNPGYAGSRNALTVDAIYRYQWVNIPGAPQTLNASIHSPLENPHLGVGMNIYSDVVGATLSQGALATFAYKILFPESKLSFGIQVGVKYSDIFWSRINPYDDTDPLYNVGMKNKVAPDANFGIYYSNTKYYFGLSSKQLLQNQMGMVKINGKEEFTKLLRHFYGMVGAAFPLTDKLVFRPSILAKFVQNAPPQVDVNASFLFANIFWIGASYRTEEAASFMTEFNLTRTMRIGYSYDIWFNELKGYNKGSHEIRLGFDFDIFHSRILTPRYF